MIHVFFTIKNKSKIIVKTHQLGQKIAILGLCALMGGCVSKSKYNELLLSKDTLQKDYNLLRDARRERQEMADSVVRVNAALASTSQELEEWKNRYASIYGSIEELNRELSNMRIQNEQLQATASATNTKLRQELADRMKELDAREKELKNLEASIQTSQGTVEELKKFLNDKEVKIKELSDALQSKDLQMSLIRQKVSDVLRGFSAVELNVRQENGKVYVSLSENLLFAKGKSDVNARGVDALKKIASALNISPEIDIEVEGHTDSDGPVDLNWSLSSARSLSVAKILIANKVDPRRIAATGRAFYKPVVANDTEANKAKNRRTEIILSPRLDELYNIIKTN